MRGSSAVVLAAPPQEEETMLEALDVNGEAVAAPGAMKPEPPCKGAPERHAVTEMVAYRSENALRSQQTSYASIEQHPTAE